VRWEFETKMNKAQTNLSRRDSLKIARRFNAGIGLDCASSPGGTAENACPFRPSLRDKIPARQTNLSKWVFSAGGAQESSPRREPWVQALNRSSSVRSDRIGRAENSGLPPLRGLRAWDIKPTAGAVGYYLSPLRGCETARN
jgi:hypothetical protein